MSNKNITKEKFIEVESLPMDVTSGKTYIINQADPNSYTHGFYKYPTKFIPEIPRWAIKKYSERNGLIFDPFLGSGTTLLEAIINGRDGYGTEIDGVSRLISKVKTTVLAQDQIESIIAFTDQFIQHDFSNIKPFIPGINNLHHWFTEENAIKLGKIKTLIDTKTEGEVRDFLNVCFASIVKPCSNADDQSPKPYVSSNVEKTPDNPYETFPDIVNSYVNDMRELMSLDIQNRAYVENGNALHPPTHIEVDLAITSPPYINAFDYGRVFRLENLWLGFLTEKELRKKKKKYVGTERINREEEEQNNEILKESDLLKDLYFSILEKDKKRALVVKKFFSDMRKNLLEVRDILTEEGIYGIVIGNNTIRGVEVASWRILSDIAENIGYTEELKFSYVIRNPYIRIPRSGRGGKINEDHIIMLRKTNNIKSSEV